MDSKSVAGPVNLLPGIKKYIAEIEKEFIHISGERKSILNRFSGYLKKQIEEGIASDLIFICTHNSRRSHMSQLWAQVAAYYYKIPGIHCFSGGTEATAFNPRSVKCLRKAGFDIISGKSGENPVYRVSYSPDRDQIQSFSKKIDDDANPKKDFAAIMTCSQADEACPFVPGASFRLSIPYDDPKLADNTPKEEIAYDERCRQIAVEMFYAFSRV
jgi:protein-tyrosine-phosphatase